MLLEATLGRGVPARGEPPLVEQMGALHTAQLEVLALQLALAADDAPLAVSDIKGV